MSQSTKQCPKCHTENPVEANFCRHCRHEFSEASKNGKSVAPVISLCQIREKNYCRGSMIHIDWVVENVTKLTLEDQDVTGASSFEIEVGKQNYLKLVAENDYTITTKEFHLNPAPLAQILFFRSNKETLQEGQSVKLTWNVRNAKQVLLKGEGVDLDVTDKSELEFTPAKSSEYTLIAISVDDSIKEERVITIAIVKEVKIISFEADKTRIAETMPVTLSWKVENADKLELLPHYQDVTGRDSITLYPKSNIEYKLVASNSISTKEAYVSVGVQSLPKIDMKSFDGLCSVKLPNISIDMSQVTRPIDEVAIENWVETPDVDSLKLKIGEVNIFSKLKKLLSRSFK